MHALQGRGRYVVRSTEWPGACPACTECVQQLGAMCLGLLASSCSDTGVGRSQVHHTVPLEPCCTVFSWATPMGTSGAPVTAAVSLHSPSPAPPCHPCLGYNSGGLDGLTSPKRRPALRNPPSPDLRQVYLKHYFLECAHGAAAGSPRPWYSALDTSCVRSDCHGNSLHLSGEVEVSFRMFRLLGVSLIHVLGQIPDFPPRNCRRIQGGSCGGCHFWC